MGPGAWSSGLARAVAGEEHNCQPPSTAEEMARKPGPAFLCGNSFALSPGLLPFFRSIYMQRRPLFLKICCSCSFPSKRRLTRSTWKEQRLCFHRKSLLTKQERGKCVQQELSSSEMALSAGSRFATLQWAVSDMTDAICATCPPPRPPSASPSQRDVGLREVPRMSV